MLHTYLVLSNCTQRALVACCCCCCCYSCCCCDASISLMMELICVAAQQSNTLRFQLPFRLANQVNANGSVRFAAAMLKALQFTVWLTVTHTPVCVCVFVESLQPFDAFANLFESLTFQFVAAVEAKADPQGEWANEASYINARHTQFTHTHTHPHLYTHPMNKVLSTWQTAAYSF